MKVGLLRVRRRGPVLLAGICLLAGCGGAALSMGYPPGSPQLGEVLPSETSATGETCMLTKVLIVAVVALGLGGVSVAQLVAVPPPVTLFQNVRIFDGKSDTVSGPTNVLIRGNLIERISATSIAPQAS
jgi:hypothetical protein